MGELVHLSTLPRVRVHPLRSGGVCVCVCDTESETRDYYYYYDYDDYYYSATIN